MSLNTILQYDFRTPGDLSPNNLNGLINNGCELNQSGASISLKSASFDGNSQYISIPQFTTPTNGITFTFWFRSINTVTWGRIFDFGNNAGSDNILAYINNNNLGFSVYKMVNNVMKSTQYDNVLGYSINSGNWIHIVWILNTNNSWTLYVNGSIVSNPGSNPGTGYYPTSMTRSRNYIGKSNWADPYFIGNICDFRMFDGILTQDNITNIYNTTNYLNYVSYKPSINNAISLTANTVMCKWSELNIASNSNMAISFTINISPSPNMWRNIVHISNTGNNCCNPGDRLPGIWIGNNDNNSKTPFILVCIDIITNPAKDGANQPIFTPSLQTGIDYTFVISLFNTTISIFCNQDPSKNVSKNFGAGFLQVNPNTPVYISDPWHATDNFKIKDIIFYNNAYNKTSYLNYVRYKPSIGKEISLVNTQICMWPELNIASNLNMAVSFTIKIQNTNPNFRNILHISNGGDSNSLGTRSPAFFIIPNSTTFHICSDVLNTVNNWNNTTKSLTLNTEYKIVISWFINKVFFFCSDPSKNESFDLLNTIFGNSNNTKVYLCDPWYTTVGGFTIKDFIFYNKTLNQQDADHIFKDTPIPIIPWKYVPSIGNYIKLFQNNYVTKWSNLNINDSSNMSVSFVIKLTTTSADFRNIFHISNNNSNSSRVPGVWINYNSSKALLIINDTTNAANVNFLTGELTINLETKVDIVWNGQNVHIYFNGILNTIYDYVTPLVKASDNAYFYLSDPWYTTVGGFMIKDFTFYNGNSINPPTSNDNYQYIGCYNDKEQRAIPNYVGNVSRKEYCKEFAISNKAKLYGVQSNGQCFIGNDINSALQYGPVTTDCPELGGTMTNQVYSIDEPSYSFWSSYGITDSTKMTLSFIINIKAINPSFRSITHVSNNGGDCCNPGNRVPAVWITAGSLSLYIRNDTNTINDDGFITNNLPPNIDIKVDITWNGKKVYVYFNNELKNIYNFSAELIKAIPNAVVYVGPDKWYPTSVDYTIQNLTFANGSTINPPTSNKVYNNIGCYNDNSSNRAVPNYMGIVSSVNDCQEYAISQNSSVFGVQNSKDCYIGNSINDALKYSEATNCSNMGGPLANQIYSIEGIPQPTYKYLNCYNDDSKVHAVPDLLGTVKNIYDCEVLAKNKAYTLYALQNGGQCYGSNNITQAQQYGIQNDKSKCTTLGGLNTNQIYTNIENVNSNPVMPNMLESINNYTYQGCYNNNDNTAIPTLLNKDLKDAATCSEIAFTKGYNTFGLTDGGCYGSSDIGQAKSQGKNDAPYYCGTSGSSRAYQIYYRDTGVYPFPPDKKYLEIKNFSEKFSNYSDNENNNTNNSRVKLFKFLIMVIFIIILIYLIYCI